MDTYKKTGYNKNKEFNELINEFESLYTAYQTKQPEVIENSECSAALAEFINSEQQK